MTDQLIKELSIELLQPNPFQPRDLNLIKTEDLDELTASIKEHGVLEPLVVTQTPAGYQIIAGERRWRASQLAGLKTVPVITKKVTPKQMLEMAIVENVQRVDLGPIERAQAFQQLKRNFNYSDTQVAEKVSKSLAYVVNSLKLLKLPDAIKDGLLGGLIDEGHARAISGIKDPHKMVQVYKKILKTNASVRQAEQLARLAKEEIGQRSTNLHRSAKSVSQMLEEIKVWEKRLKRVLKSKSTVKLQRSLRQTKITITLKGDAKKTEKDLARIMELTTGKQDE
ncbi:ParB/RepB/Spo0J family partition protein [Candidatus Woesebacteria bacterium]|nr:ParB/RepB/Spo0J family partition protein [Candidatus Woesebacteria bacterium]